MIFPCLSVCLRDMDKEEHFLMSARQFDSLVIRLNPLFQCANNMPSGINQRLGVTLMVEL